MPRNGEAVRRRLQQAALELYSEGGYDRTTATEIAHKAGVTERTFFRHFPDKREVLFDGETALSESLTQAMQDAPAGLGAWETLLFAFRAVEPLFVENRPLSEPRARVIASNPALQEREMAKTGALVVMLAGTLGKRGIDKAQAKLAAQVGMIVLAHAVSTWLNDETGDLNEHLTRTLADVRAMSAAEPQVFL